MTKTSPNFIRRPSLECSEFTECISILNTKLSRNLQVCLEFKEFNYNKTTHSVCVIMIY